MSQKIKGPYFGRALMPMPIYVAVFFSEEDYLKECKRLGIKNPDLFVPMDANACVHYFENDEKMETDLMCVDFQKIKAKSLPESYAIIVHEVTHVWQAIKAYLGEKAPSSEFEAYSVQHLCLSAFEAFDKYRGEHADVDTAAGKAGGTQTPDA